MDAPGGEMSASTMDTVGGMARKYSVAFKRQVVEEALAPGASVSAVSRKRDLNANMVFTWRKQYRSGEMGGESASAPDFVAVGIVNEAGRPVPVLATPDAERARLPQRNGPKAVPVSRVVELELRNGVKLRVDAGIATETLRRIVGAMAAV
jgi:transposase